MEPGKAELAIATGSMKNRTNLVRLMQVREPGAQSGSIRLGESDAERARDNRAGQEPATYRRRRIP
jgi:hypothetical protein